MTAELSSKQDTDYFPGTKVFIALRTDMFGVENEHITLDFHGAFAETNKVLENCERFKNLFYGLPIQVAVNGYANWRTSNNMFHHVALVEFMGRPNFQGRNWHVTLESRDEPFLREELYPVQLDEPLNSCEDIWIGYTTLDGKEKKWLRYDGLDMEIA